MLFLAPRAAAQSGPIVWVVKSIERVGPDDAAGSGAQAQIYAAKGEYESFQIVVKAPTVNALSNVNVTVSDLLGTGGQIIPKQSLSLFREQYVNVSTSSPNWGGSNQPLPKGMYPDPLIPFSDPSTGLPITSATLKAVPFSLAASKNQPIWVDVLVPRTAAAGYYSGSFTVTSDQGSATGQINLTVWNFTLPVKPALKSSFLYWTASSTAAIQELLRNRINPERTPSTVQRSMIDSFGLTSQETGFWSGADVSHCTMSAAPSVSQFQSAASAQQPDLHLYNYTADEIDQCANLYPTMQQWAANMHKAGIHNLVTMAPVPALMDDGTGTGRSAVDMWVMLPVVYDRNVVNVQTALAKGDSAWSYNCLVQDAYSPKWMLDFAPINFRIQPGFINESLNLSGLLYWRVDNWSADPWNSAYAPGFANYPGESILVYPGTTVGIQGVAPSMRLKWLRDGADDFDYIELLKQAGKGAWALSVAGGVGANWSQWTRDINALENARIQLGQQLDLLGGGGATVPGTPANPSPADATAGVSLTPTLTWSAAANATSYDFYLGTTPSPPLVHNMTTTSHISAALNANTTYYWKVVAKNSAGSTSSAAWSFTTQLAVPGTPANPAPATGATGVSVTPTLSWSAASNAASYDVYFGTSATPALAGNTTATSYTPAALNANTTYYWKVVAKNSAGSTSSATWSFTTQLAVPGTPANPAPATGATGVSVTPALSWSAASGAASYDVYLGTSATPALAGNTTATSYTPAALNANTTYYWRVVAKNAAGSTSSATWSFTTAATLGPVSVSPSSGAGTIQTFSFTYSAPNGVANANVLFNTAVSGQAACWFNYNTAYNQLSLASDNSSTWSYSKVGTGATLQNSQCSLQVKGVVVTSSGSNLTLTVPITFKSSFLGQKGIYLRVQDKAGTMTSFVKMGTWTVQ